MIRRILVPLLLIATFVLGGLGIIGPNWRALILSVPVGTDLQKFNDAQRDAVFRLIDQVPFIPPVKEMLPGPNARELPFGEPLLLETDLNDYLDQQRGASILIIHKGKIRGEAYGLGANKDMRWPGFSVGKSMTSTVMGAAIKDGYIEGVQEPITKYIPELVGSGYDGVTIEHALMMSSGLEWGQRFNDSAYDTYIGDESLPKGVSYTKDRQRAFEPGVQFNYQNAESDVLGEIIRRASGKDITEYLTEIVWKPFGMEAKGTWFAADRGNASGAGGIQVTTRDYARFGMFILNEFNGEPSGELPDGWVQAASAMHVADTGEPGWGYGYQWWTFADGSFTADGVWGQAIFVDPNRDLVMASGASWSHIVGQGDAGEFFERDRFWAEVKAAIDREAAG